MSRFKFVVFAVNRDFDQLVFANSDFFTSAVYYNTLSEFKADVETTLQEVSEEQGTEIALLWDIAFPNKIARNLNFRLNSVQAVAFQVADAKSMLPLPSHKQMYVLVKLIDNDRW